MSPGRAEQRDAVLTYGPVLQVNRSQEEALVAVKETLSEQARAAEVMVDTRILAIDRFRPQRPFAPLRRRHRMYTQAAWPDGTRTWPLGRRAGSGVAEWPAQYLILAFWRTCYSHCQYPHPNSSCPPECNLVVAAC